MNIIEKYKKRRELRRFITEVQKIGNTKLYFIISTSVPKHSLYSYELDTAESYQLRSFMGVADDIKISFEAKVNKRKAKNAKEKRT